MDESIVILGPGSALVADISTPPQEQHFDANPDIEVGNIELRLGKGPIMTDLSERSRSTGKELDQELKYLESRFKVLLLSTSLGILKVPGLRSVTQLQYTLDFDSNEELAIVDLFPNEEIVEAAKVSLGSRSDVSAGVDAKGNLGIIAPTAQGTAYATIGSLQHAAFVADFQYSIYAVKTQAIGKYGKTAIWNFSNKGKPLVGDFVFATTVLLDRYVKTRLRFKVRMSASVTRMGLFPEQRMSDWIQHEIDISKVTANLGTGNPP